MRWYEPEGGPGLQRGMHLIGAGLIIILMVIQMAESSSSHAAAGPAREVWRGTHACVHDQR